MFKLFDIFKRKMFAKLDSIEFKEVVSYATRPKRDNEVNGKEHLFITDQEADEILKKYRPAAYTEIGSIRYFVLKPQLKEGNLYVIDPKGIRTLLKNAGDIRDYVILYITVDAKIRDARAKLRPSYDEYIYNSRVQAEAKQFFDFESDVFTDRIKLPVYHINNNSNDIEIAMKQVYKIIYKTYNTNTMYLIVGRTCSGKDTICRKLVERNKHE